MTPRWPPRRYGVLQLQPILVELHRLAALNFKPEVISFSPCRTEGDEVTWCRADELGQWQEWRQVVLRSTAAVQS